MKIKRNNVNFKMASAKKMRIKKKTTNAQFDVLVRELGRFPKGKILNRAKFDALWEKIALKVNSIGPPQRNVSEWKKVWSDLKRRTQQKTVVNEPWEAEQSAWLSAANVSTDLEQSATADNHSPLNKESNFELPDPQTSNSNIIPPISEAPVLLQTTIKSEPGTTGELGMEGENLNSYIRTPPSAVTENQPTAGLFELLLSMTHSMTTLVERQTAVAERQAAALERQAAATERQATAIERQAFATGRQAAATHAVLKLLSIQFEPAENKK